MSRYLYLDEIMARRQAIPEETRRKGRIQAVTKKAIVCNIERKIGSYSFYHIIARNERKRTAIINCLIKINYSLLIKIIIQRNSMNFF